MRDRSEPTQISYKIPSNKKNNQILKMIINKYIFTLKGSKNITLLYTIVPIGVGGHFFHVILFRSKIGLGDQNFQGK